MHAKPAKLNYKSQKKMKACLVELLIPSVDTSHTPPPYPHLIFFLAHALSSTLEFSKIKLVFLIL